MRRSFAEGACLVLFLASAAAGQTNPPASRAEQFETQFDKFDTNGDGTLSRDELAGRPFFDRADRDGDGAVTREEARAALRDLPAQPRRGVGRRIGLPKPDDGIERKLDIAYAGAEEGGGARLKLDVYRRKDAEGQPVMVYVHGGGWRRGDKSAVGNKVPFFPNKGYVFVSVNYRMLPDRQVPGQAEDVAAAIAWVHDHAGEIGGDPDRIYLMGHSAGAHLVSLVATNETFLGKSGKDLSILKGVIELDTAAFDIPRVLETGEGFYGEIFGDDPEIHCVVSPARHVAADKSIPPFLLVVADNNQRKLTLSNEMAEKLRAAKIPAKIVEAPDKTHGTLNQQLGAEGDKPTEAVMEFLKSLEQPAK